MRLLPSLRSVDVGGWHPWDENGLHRPVGKGRTRPVVHDRYMGAKRSSVESGCPSASYSAKGRYGLGGDAHRGGAGALLRVRCAVPGTAVAAREALLRVSYSEHPRPGHPTKLAMSGGKRPLIAFYYSEAPPCHDQAGRGGFWRTRSWSSGWRTPCRTREFASCRKKQSQAVADTWSSRIPPGEVQPSLWRVVKAMCWTFTRNAMTQSAR